MKLSYPIDGLCPILKVPFDFGFNHDDLSPIMDRLVLSRSHVAGNISITPQ